MQQLILDPKGDFYVNTSQFCFVDAMSGVRFEPGLHIKTQATAWMKSQPTIVKVEVEPDKPVKPTRTAQQS
jgi:hypothetical protein